MMKAVATFIMQGGRQATIVSATMAILSLLMPPLLIISVACVCLVTLRNGSADGLRVVIGSTVATALIGYIVLGTSLVSFTYLFIMWLPAFLISLVLRETGELNKALEFLVILGMLAVTGLYLTIDNPAQLWATGIQEVVKALAEQQELPVTEAELEEGLLFWSQYITGVVVAGTLISLLMSLLLGRWWQGLLFNEGGFDKEFSHLRLLPRDGLVFAILVVLGVLLDGQFAEYILNLDIQVLLLFFIVGVSVVHVVIKGRGGSRYLLFVFYMAIFFVPHLILPLVLIGLSDVWMDWRQRFV
ncbi:MAG: hypothetical protein ACJA2Y_001238 [Cycloclasticus pugetii]|jgi:hypothetical protein|uniref:Membrane protein n=2 Tax=Cycloclasticus TaxID=34067 RepID=S5TH43_9GAMM|nr:MULTISPECIES: DUF2232 domain-containing protein [Cycloclasticus]AGS40202.1 Membrane protein [Cycloclasticus zancles 78-ME]SHJ00647.1 Predicted membrane protein [Cycloclasticus pugetii]